MTDRGPLAVPGQVPGQVGGQVRGYSRFHSMTLGAQNPLHLRGPYSR